MGGWGTVPLTDVRPGSRVKALCRACVSILYYYIYNDTLHYIIIRSSVRRCVCLARVCAAALRRARARSFGVAAQPASPRAPVADGGGQDSVAAQIRRRPRYQQRQQPVSLSSEQHAHTSAKASTHAHTHTRAHRPASSVSGPGGRQSCVIRGRDRRVRLVRASPRVVFAAARRFRVSGNRNGTATVSTGVSHRPKPLARVRSVRIRRTARAGSHSTGVVVVVVIFFSPHRPPDPFRRASVVRPVAAVVRADTPIVAQPFGRVAPI